MKELIQEIVDADRAAQEEIAEAKKQRAEIGERIKKEAELRKATYTAEAEQEIARQRLATEKREKAKWEARQVYYRDLKEKLDAVYAAHKEAWVSELVSRVLGK